MRGFHAEIRLARRSGPVIGGGSGRSSMAQVPWAVSAIGRSGVGYGARRVQRGVPEGGVDCGLHPIERLMRQNTMKARPKPRRAPKDDGERPVIAGDIRDCEADRPNQAWRIGVACIRTAQGWLHAAVVPVSRGSFTHTSCPPSRSHLPELGAKTFPPLSGFFGIMGSKVTYVVAPAGSNRHSLSQPA